MNFPSVIKLSDFGSAASVSDYNNANGGGGGDAANGQQQQHVRGNAGTLRYMAPEVLRARAYAANCDLWSVGMTLLDMLYIMPREVNACRSMPDFYNYYGAKAAQMAKEQSNYRAHLAAQQQQQHQQQMAMQQQQQIHQQHQLQQSAGGGALNTSTGGSSGSVAGQGAKGTSGSPSVDGLGTADLGVAAITSAAPPLIPIPALATAGPQRDVRPPSISPFFPQLGGAIEALVSQHVDTAMAEMPHLAAFFIHHTIDRLGSKGSRIYSPLVEGATVTAANATAQPIGAVAVGASHQRYVHNRFPSGASVASRGAGGGGGASPPFPDTHDASLSLGGHPQMQHPSPHQQQHQYQQYGPSHLDLVRAVTASPLLCIAEAKAYIAHDLASLLETCLALNPRDRCGSAASLLTHPLLCNPLLLEWYDSFVNKVAAGGAASPQGAVAAAEAEAAINDDFLPPPVTAPLAAAGDAGDALQKQQTKAFANSPALSASMGAIGGRVSPRSLSAAPDASAVSPATAGVASRGVRAVTLPPGAMPPAIAAIHNAQQNFHHARSPALSAAPDAADEASASLSIGIGVSLADGALQRAPSAQSLQSYGRVGAGVHSHSRQLSYQQQLSVPTVVVARHHTAGATVVLSSATHGNTQQQQQHQQYGSTAATMNNARRAAAGGAATPPLAYFGGGAASSAGGYASALSGGGLRPLTTLPNPLAHPISHAGGGQQQQGRHEQQQLYHPPRHAAVFSSDSASADTSAVGRPFGAATVVGAHSATSIGGPTPMSAAAVGSGAAAAFIVPTLLAVPEANPAAVGGAGGILGTALAGSGNGGIPAAAGGAEEDDEATFVVRPPAFGRHDGSAHGPFGVSAVGLGGDLTIGSSASVASTEGRVVDAFLGGSGGDKSSNGSSSGAVGVRGAVAGVRRRAPQNIPKPLHAGKPSDASHNVDAAAIQSTSAAAAPAHNFAAPAAPPIAPPPEATTTATTVGSTPAVLSPPTYASLTGKRDSSSDTPAASGPASAAVLSNANATALPFPQVVPAVGALPSAASSHPATMGGVAGIVGKPSLSTIPVFGHPSPIANAAQPSAWAAPQPAVPLNGPSAFSGPSPPTGGDDLTAGSDSDADGGPPPAPLAIQPQSAAVAANKGSARALHQQGAANVLPFASLRSPTDQQQHRVFSASVPSAPYGLPTLPTALTGAVGGPSLQQQQLRGERNPPASARGPSSSNFHHSPLAAAPLASQSNPLGATATTTITTTTASLTANASSSFAGLGVSPATVAPASSSSNAYNINLLTHISGATVPGTADSVPLAAPPRPAFPPMPFLGGVGAGGGGLGAGAGGVGLGMGGFGPMFGIAGRAPNAAAPSAAPMRPVIGFDDDDDDDEEEA